MNILILTKISKFMIISSLTAYLSFSGKFNPSMRAFFFYLLGGIIATFLLAALWEARDYLVSNDSTEEQLTTLIGGLNNQKSGRQYYLSSQTRLEIVIAFVTIIISALVGGI